MMKKTCFIVCLLAMVALLIPALGETEAGFSPDQLKTLKSATLIWRDGEYLEQYPVSNFVDTLKDEKKLEQIAALLSDAEESEPTSCLFKSHARLLLHTGEDKLIELELAADSCTIFRIGEKYYNYLYEKFRNMPDAPDNSILYDQFSPAETSLLPVPEPRVMPTPRADGKPAFWYGDFAPRHFWETLDRSPWQGKAMADWEKAFGKNQDYWPLEVKALEFLSRQGEDNDYWTAMPGLPGPDEVSQERALYIAQAELAQSKKLDTDVKMRLVPDFSFSYYQEGFEHGNTWLIHFRDPENMDQGVFFSVLIDARNGGVMQALHADEGNG